MHNFGHTLRQEFAAGWRTISITTGGVAGALMLVQMVRWINRPVVFNLWNGYGLIMTVTGVILTSGVFRELRSPGQRIEFLLRPVSTLEKVGAKLVVSTVVYGLAMTLAYVVASLLALVVFLMLGGQGDLLMFLDGGRWLLTAGSAFLDFLPVHAVFFFGAVYFRRNPAGRTLLALVGAGASYLLVTLLLAQAVFFPYMSGRYAGVEAPRAFGLHLDSRNGLVFAERIWVQVVPGFLQNGEINGILFRVAIIVIFWGLAVLRLRETEG